MNNRNIFEEILSLAKLAGVDAAEIEHIIVALAAGDTHFGVPDGRCAVIVAVEQFNVDESLPNTMTRGAAGETITVSSNATAVAGQDVLYVYGPGRATISLTATAAGGFTYSGRAVGYLLPQSAYARLSGMSTKILS
jgi:hypothetical protein